jgi:Tfp pilus assembly protein PilF
MTITQHSTDFQEIFDQALRFQRDGDAARAELLYQKLLLYFPDHTPTLINLGVLLKNKGHLEAAMAVYTRAYTLDPQSLSVLGNLGNVLCRLGRLDESLACHDQVLKSRPDTPEAYYNKGLTLRAMGRFPQAIFCFDRALALRSEYADAAWDRAFTLLMAGELQEGFAAYEARWAIPGVTKPELSGVPWNGEDISHKCILVYAEQGFGDTLHFIRYAELLKRRKAEVHAYVQPELVSLLKNCSFLSNVYPYGDTLPRCDMQAPLLSLPHLIGATSTAFWPEAPYISLPEMSTNIPDFLNRPGKLFKIGIVWAGNPNHRNDKQRSIGLPSFIKLLTVPGTAFFSLQVGERRNDIKTYGVEGLVDDLADSLSSFLDTAKTIAGLDLIITVDTAVAHLAGAMGRPVWVVLPKIGDWRWGAKDTVTPWYPSMRLFRQTVFAEWNDVLEEMVTQLDAVVTAQ